MQRLADSLVLTPTDLAESLLCDHLVALELAQVDGTQQKPEKRDPAMAVLARRGEEHEQRYLKSLTDAGLNVVEISASYGAKGLETAVAKTLEAMHAGADVVYQATFFDGRWRGKADFLRRVDVPSDLGNHSYEVIDTKLARSAKVEALLQLSNYSEHVTRLQGVRPQQMHIVLGNNIEVSFNVGDFDAYYRTIKRRFEAMVDEGIELEKTYPDPVAHCAVCDWVDQCVERRVNDDHLSIVAGMGRHQIEKLKELGITRLADLGNAQTVADAGLKGRVLQKMHDQARMQVQQRESGQSRYELLEPEGDARGFGALPEPSHGDLFFDMEGDPYVGTHGLEYLFGVTEESDGKLTYKPWWGHDAAGEKAAFECFIDYVMQALLVDPNLHIYHYAPYEVTAMKRLAGVHGTREVEVDHLLRNEVFVDLYRVVRQAIRISQDSYSIKKLEVFYMGKRETDVVGGAASIVAYENWIELQEQKLLDDIELYNKDDCDSTLKLRNWLEGLRTEAEGRFGPIARPSVEVREASEKVQTINVEIDAILRALAARTGGTDAELAGERLMAGLMEWHRREDRSDWWRFFDLQKMSDDDLFADREAISGLIYEGSVDTIAKSTIERYRFDPAQDQKMEVGKDAIDPRTGKKSGEVWAISDAEGIIDLKRSNGTKAPRPSALMPPGPIDHGAQQRALIDVGRWVADNGGDSSGRFRAARDLLLRLSPRLAGGRAIASAVASASDSTAAAIDLVQSLDTSCLAVQGPPGSGKTYTGAEVILALVASGKRVGITANSHKVISNVLQAVVDHGSSHGQTVRIVQKSDKDQCVDPSVTQAKKNDAVDAALDAGEVDVVAGTAWLFARSEMREVLDVLIIDEAGQMSLADVVAVSTAAKSIVLSGDPQQLAQPSKGMHPDGAEASALGHLLGEHQTIPDDLGLLLDRSWRMHPDICSYISTSFYDNRLTSVDACAQQTVVGDGFYAGTGLRMLPVEHAHNRTSSIEEASAIGDGIKQLLGQRWIDRDGESRAITLNDILIVAPYNAQVQLLKAELVDGARVGTVDKFQGQEAAVVFYSLAASSPDDISRGMEFLYSHNRLNVAISRAQCLAFLVCNPSLLTIACTTPEQMRLANALCALAEQAEVQS